MQARTGGIHHVTAIAGDAQHNIDFYAGFLGLRLVKLTVNFDDPGSYHLYYGDEIGHPGTVMTFFAWPNGGRGRVGIAQVGVTAFAIRPASLPFWSERLGGFGIPVEEPTERFDEQVLTFQDPDGLLLELVAHPGAEDLPSWEGGPVAGEHALRGFHGVTLFEEGFAHTQRLLTDTLGFLRLAEEGSTFRYRSQDGGPGALVDLRAAPNLPVGRVGIGAVHHVAWRVPDDATQQALRARLDELDYNVTPVLDREYFHSVYFPEPGGVLFEIATDPPGFTIDESVAELGSHLKLPPWLEPHREEIVRRLPPLQLPSGILQS